MQLQKCRFLLVGSRCSWAFIPSLGFLCWILGANQVPEESWIWFKAIINSVGINITTSSVYEQQCRVAAKLNIHHIYWNKKLQINFQAYLWTVRSLFHREKIQPVSECLCPAEFPQALWSRDRRANWHQSFICNLVSCLKAMQWLLPVSPQEPSRICVLIMWWSTKARGQDGAAVKLESTGCVYLLKSCVFMLQW